jgi:glycosyltransferase involved in cell wall biosynthesis
MDRLNILHVFRAPVGGLWRHVMDLARAQAERGHRVGIVCDADTGGDRARDQLDSLSAALTLGVRRLPMRRNPHWTDMSAQVGLGRFASDVGADVIHGHGSKGGLYARLPAVAGRRGPIRVYTPHGGSLNYFPGTALHKIYMATERLLERGTDLFLFESLFIRRRYEEFVGPTNRLVKVVPNGLYPHEYDPVTPEPDAKDFLYIGEFRFAKGIDNLLAALVKLRMTRGRAPTLLLVGSGPDEEALRARVAEFALGDIVSFMQPMPARQAFTKARMMVVPSRFESMPYVVLEAAGAMVPLISTDVGGIPEIFGPEASRLIQSENVAALATAMAAMLDAPAEARHADATRLQLSMRETFSVATMVDTGLAAYAEARRARQ